MPSKATSSRRSARRPSPEAPNQVKANPHLLAIAATMEAHAADIIQQAAALRAIAAPLDLPMIFERQGDDIIPRSANNPDGTPRVADGKQWLDLVDAADAARKSPLEMRALWLSVCHHFEQGEPK